MNKIYKINLHGKEVEIEQLPNGKFKKPEFISKYDKLRSSCVPLKQTTEIWNIYRKPFKTGTVTRDIIAYEEGDQTIAPSGLNIDGGRVATNEIIGRNNTNTKVKKFDPEKGWNNNNMIGLNSVETNNKRYPSQLFLDGSISYKREDIDLDNKDFLEFIGIDSDVISFMEKEKAIDYVCAHLDKFNVAELLDEQSGNMKSSYRPHFDNGSQYKYKEGSKNVNIGGGQVNVQYDDNGGGCSRILHNSSFTLTELYQHIFYSKPSKYEREAMINDEVIKPKKYFHDGRKSPIEYPSMRDSLVSVNNHPTLKSLKLLYNIIQLFNTVDIEKMKILIPFSGVNSEKIAWLAHGAKEENIIAIELNEEYQKIGEARENFWIENNFFFKENKEIQTKIKQSIEKKNKKKRKSLYNIKK